MIGNHMERLRSITENIVNNTSPGYRKTVLSNRPFDALFRRESADCTLKTDFTEGQTRSTDNPLDFAIQGNGFFAIQNEDTVLYTRNGQFHFAPDGTLVNSSNLPVQGEGGTISLPTGMSADTLTVTSDGSLAVDGRDIGRFRIVSFRNPETLIRAGTSLFTAGDTTEEIAPSGVTVANRMLEGSNSSIYEEMAELVDCTRSFEMCQKVIKARDGAESEMVKNIV